MALGGTDLLVILRGHIMGQAWQVGQWYRISGAAFLTADCSMVGNAWWQDVKAAWRAAMPNATQFSMEIVHVSEPGLTGQYGEYGIPGGEQVGTRTASSLDMIAPQFVAAGIKLTVGSRTTKPGQKRIPGMLEADEQAGVLQAGYLTLVNAVAAKYSAVITLGAPVALGEMMPEVVRLDPVTREITAKQDITGFIVNANATTQNSRKIGHGA